MIDTINLSKRLTVVASFLPQNAFFADIGSDHAYLPCYVCLQDKGAQAIAGEVNEGPYRSALETVAAHCLTDQIAVRLGDGLEVVRNEPIKQVVIAGMGGSLITKILEDGQEYLIDVERIIAQPNIGESNVRKWFLENGFTITHEVMIEENGHLYEVLVADKESVHQPYDRKSLDKQLFFGPLLLGERSEVFLRKWRSQRKKHQQVITQMKQATIPNLEKIEQLERELDWIKEVIHDDN